MIRTLNGWQRLWVVAAALYLVPVSTGVVSFFPAREQIESSRVYAAIGAVAEHRKASEPELRWEGAYSVRTTFYRDLSNDEIISRLNEKWGTKVDFSNIEEEYRRKIEALPFERAKIIGLGFLAWLIPVLFIYALGAAVAWIIRGFRSGIR